MESPVIAAVRKWIASVVVEFDLCPFAQRELARGSVLFVETGAGDKAALLRCLALELEFLDHNPAVETTLLVHPGVLQDFYDFNHFLDACDDLLARLDLKGVYQIASFHPHYQFAGTAPEDAENYSNRSPYPMLHILREDSVERAIAAHGDIESVPHRNIALLKRLGRTRLEDLLRASLDG